MAELKESKEKLPLSFLTDFVSRGWEDIGYLKATIESIKESFSGTKKVEDLLQALVDAYLVCIGQLEAHLQAKDYLDTDIDNKLTEDIGITVSKDEVKVFDAQGEEAAVIPVNVEEQTADEVIPPAEVEMPVVTEPVEEPIAADNGEFNTPFEFDVPEADGVRQFEKPEVADFFVDFDDPVGEPVTEKELYGEGEDQIEGEKIDDDIEDEEPKEE